MLFRNYAMITDFHKKKLVKTREYFAKKFKNLSLLDEYLQ